MNLFQILKFWNQWIDEIHPSWKLEELAWSAYVFSASMWSVFQYLQRIHWIQIHIREGFSDNKNIISKRLNQIFTDLLKVWSIFSE